MFHFSLMKIRGHITNNGNQNKICLTAINADCHPLIPPSKTGGQPWPPQHTFILSSLHIEGITTLLNICFKMRQWKLLVLNILSKKFELFNICTQHVSVRFYLKYTVKEYLAANSIHLLFLQSVYVHHIPRAWKGHIARAGLKGGASLPVALGANL